MKNVPVLPILKVGNVLNAIDFYQRAFGALQDDLLYGPDGSSVLRAIITLDDYPLILVATPDAASVELRDQQEIGITLQFYGAVQVYYRQALQAGATSIVAPQKLPDGSDLAQICDPFNHYWILRTSPTENLEKK